MTATALQTGHASVNGLQLYYEIHGSGQPTILLHGSLGLIDMFAPILPMLAENRQVIGVELQGHGHTTDSDRPFSVEAMADDVAVLITYLGFEQADVVGCSMGGAVALRMAIQHPDVVRKVVVVSAPYKRDGMLPDMRAGMDQLSAAAAPSMQQTPIYQSYAAVAPHPEDFPRLLDKMGEMLRKPYDWSNEVKTLKMPVMLVIGDRDAISPAHAAEFFALLGGGLRDSGGKTSVGSNAHLAILPGLTHFTIFRSPVLATTIVPFLDASKY